MFRQGSFVIDPNATPEQIARKRAEIAALMPNFGSARYVGEGLGQLATGIGMGLQRRKLDQAETAGRQSAQERFNAILGGGIQGRAQPGSLSVLGPMPAPDPNSPHALGNDAMAALGKAPIATAADPASIRQGLIARGLPEHVADGFVMNMQDESGLNPGINEIAPLVPGSRGGFGLYQLTGPRRRAYEAFAAERGVPVDDVDAQLDFLMMELQGPEAAAAARIMAAPDAGSAAAAIVTDFLRPAPEHRDRRVAEYTGGGRVVSDAMNSPQMAAATVPMDALVSILSDPWATPEQRQMAQTMLDQQTQMSDPAYRMGLRADELAIQKAERELAQMDQPQTPEQLRERQALAAAGGLQPGTPEYQSFILTGELPAQPARPLSAEQRQFWGIPETDQRPYVMGKDGVPEPIGGSGVTVNNNLPASAEPLGTEGQVLVPDASEPSGFRVEIAPGSKLDIERQATEQKGNRASDNAVIASQTVTDAANRALEAARNRNFGSGGTSLVASLPIIGAMTDSGEVIRQNNVLASQAITGNLQAMRDASPTGGALGAVTAPELKLLADKSGALDPDSPNYERDLADYTLTLLRTIHGKDAGEAVFRETWKGTMPESMTSQRQPETPPALEIGTVEDGWEYIGGDPAQPESWRKVQ